MLLVQIGIGYIVYRYMHCFFDAAQVERKKELISYIIYFAAGYLISLFDDTFLINVAANSVLIYLLAQIYMGKQGKKLLAACLIIGMNMLCAAAASFLLYDYRLDGGYSTEEWYISFLLMFLCERIVEKFSIKNMREEYSFRNWDLLIFLPVISVLILFVLIASGMDNRFVGITISIGLVLLNLIVFYICDELVGAYIRLEENAIVERQLESYSNQLDVLMKSEERVRGLRHDLKHHLNEIMMMAEGNRPEDIKAYIQNMQMYMTNEKEYASSGNADIDSLLNLMLDKAKSELRDVRCKVSVPCELDISSFDWNIILGNLLDNAIRAAKDSEEGFLYLKIAYQRGMVLIHIKNSYRGKLLKADGKYLSTKDYDRTDTSQIHGMGIRNVEKIAEKYNGSIEINDEACLFDVKIILYAAVKGSL